MPPTWTFGTERFDPECVGLIRIAASRLGHPALDIASQAGHDAYHAVLARAIR